MKFHHHHHHWTRVSQWLWLLLLHSICCWALPFIRSLFLPSNSIQFNSVQNCVQVCLCIQRTSNHIFLWWSCPYQKSMSLTCLSSSCYRAAFFFLSFSLAWIAVVAIRALSICAIIIAVLLVYKHELMCAIPHVDWPFLAYIINAQFFFSWNALPHSASTEPYECMSERTRAILTRACQVQILNDQLRNDSHWMISNTSNVLIIAFVYTINVQFNWNMPGNFFRNFSSSSYFCFCFCAN